MPAVVIGTAFGYRDRKVITNAIFTCNNPAMNLVDNGNGTYSAVTTNYQHYLITCQAPGYQTRTQNWYADDGDNDVANFPMFPA